MDSGLGSRTSHMYTPFTIELNFNGLYLRNINNDKILTYRKTNDDIVIIIISIYYNKKNDNNSDRNKNDPNIK